VATINYAQTHAFVANPPNVAGHVVQRPWLEVEFHSPPNSRRVWCLVDTGADDTVVPLGVAAILGIQYLNLPVVQVATANGNANLYKQAGMTLDLAGAVGVVADVVFGVVSTPLLGRSALLNAVEAGFEITQWHHT
jgi:predicted aspartyl protease